MIDYSSIPDNTDLKSKPLKPSLVINREGYRNCTGCTKLIGKYDMYFSWYNGSVKNSRQELCLCVQYLTYMNEQLEGNNSD